jgi:transglutaminase-like putative cysteine protease
MPFELLTDVDRRPASREGFDQARAFYSGARVGETKTAPLKTGAAGLQQIVDALQASAVEGGADPKVAALARSIIWGIADPDLRVQKLFAYCADDRRVPYVLDPVDLQVAPSVRAAMESKGVDCKGKTILLASMIRSIGYQARLVTADQNVGMPGPANDHHIYVEWQHPSSGQWLPADPVLRTEYPDAQAGDRMPEKHVTIWENPE